MTKIEIADYLANLMTIEAYYDDIGVSHRWLNAEMAATSKIFEQTLEQERENETRKRHYLALGREEGAHPPQGQPRRSEPNRNGNGNKTEHGKGFRRPGPQSPNGCE